MMTARDNAEAFDAAMNEGRKAFLDGKPQHANPYDYKWEPIAANAWDDGYKQAAASK